MNKYSNTLSNRFRCIQTSCIAMVKLEDKTKEQLLKDIVLSILRTTNRSKISWEVVVWVTSQPTPSKSYMVVGLNSAAQPKCLIDKLINKEMEKYTKIASVFIPWEGGKG